MQTESRQQPRPDGAVASPDAPDREFGTSGPADGLASLLACAAVSLVLYGLLLATLIHLGTVEPSYSGEVVPGVEVLRRETIERRHAATSVPFLALILALFGMYAVGLVRARTWNTPRCRRLAFGAGALFLLLQLLSPVMLSTDVFAYAMYGRIQAIYGGDPYLKLEPPYPDDPFLPLSYFLPWPSWYGPLWTAISGVLALGGREHVGVTVLLFRGFAVLSALAAGGLVWAILRRTDPARATQGLVFFLWNPLVVLESGLSGHNDAFVAALLLLGVWLSSRDRRLIAVVAFTLAAMVKLVTGLLLPLYLVLVVRRLATARERGRFLARAAAAGLLTAGVLFLVVGHGHRLPVAESAAAAYFYDNNVYQVLLPRVRVWLGEDPESARVPVHFYPWWAETVRPTTVESTPGGSSRDVERVKAGTKFLVIAPLDQGWVQVHNPQSKRQGYVQEAGLDKIERPDHANADPSLARLERNPAAGAIAARANSLIRVLTWTAFIAFLVLALRRIEDRRSWLVWSAAAFLAVYWLVATEIWPWYVIWSLALAALVPGSSAARLAAVLSCTVLTLYVTIGFERTAQSWLFTYRSLPAFVLPLLIFFGLFGAGGLMRLVRSRCGQVRPTNAYAAAHEVTA